MRLGAWATAAILALVPSAWARQDTPDADGKRQDKKDTGTLQSPVPTKEHDWLKQFEGEWDVKSKFMKDPSKTEEGTGTETARMEMGGLWLVIDHKGQMPGKTFEGHGMIGWDSKKQMFVGTWVDNCSARMMPFEGKEKQTSEMTYSRKSSGVK